MCTSPFSLSCVLSLVYTCHICVASMYTASSVHITRALSRVYTCICVAIVHGTGSKWPLHGANSRKTATHHVPYETTRCTCGAAVRFMSFSATNFQLNTFNIGWIKSLFWKYMGLFIDRLFRMWLSLWAIKLYHQKANKRNSRSTLKPY